MDETKQGDDGIAPVSAQGCRLPAEKLNSTCFCSSLETNFRTPGGGFAPVYPLRDEDARVEIDVIGRQADTGHACCAGQCG